MSSILELGTLLGEMETLLEAVARILLVDGALKMYWIPAEGIPSVWEQIEPFVKQALRNDSVLTLPDIRAKLVDSDSQLFVILEDGFLHTVGVFSLFRDGFGDRYCEITALAGRNLLNQSLFLRCVEEWARGNGCRYLRADTFEAGARLFRQFGFRIRNVEIVKEL